MVKRDGADDSIGLEEPLRKALRMVRESGGNVGEAVEVVSRKLRMERYETARLLYRLKELGYVRFEDPNPPKTFLRYLFSSHVIWFWLLVCSIVITLLLVYLVPQVPPFTYMRYAFGSLFVLYLPGAALIELLYPKPSDLSQLERLALSIGLSLALVPLVGLILNYTPWGIRLNPVITSLSMLALALAVGAAARKFSLLKLTLVGASDVGR